MKKLLLLLIVAGFTLTACKKAEMSPTEPVQTENRDDKEVSLEQETKIYTNSKGDQLKVSYFAEGTAVAVKIQKNDEPERKLTAKTVSASGNPVFTDDTYMWEMNDSASGGRLSDKDGNAMEYRKEE